LHCFQLFIKTLLFNQPISPVLTKASASSSTGMNRELSEDRWREVFYRLWNTACCNISWHQFQTNIIKPL